MLEVNLDNVRSLLGLGLIKVIPTYPITKDVHFRLIHDIKVKLSDGREVVISKNFEFDGSSAPRLIWWLFPSYGNFFFAALLHDNLYSRRYLSEEIGLSLAQRYADDQMLIWSNVLNDKTYWKLLDNKLRYKAVRWFGKKQYLD